MNFYIVFCKNRKKIDKYIKINKIRNKIIVDIRQTLEDMDISNEDIEKYSEFFNLLIYTKITQGLKKNKDIYYIPNFTSDIIEVEDILKIRDYFKEEFNFNALFIYEDFQDDPKLQYDILSKLHNFDTRQILKDY